MDSQVVLVLLTLCVYSQALLKVNNTTRKQIGGSKKTGPEGVFPTVTVTPDKITIAQGTTGTLTCAVTGTPKPTVIWSKPRGELTSRHQVDGNNTLKITNAQIKDGGIYICRAGNSAGQGQGFSVVNVKT